MKNKAYDPDFVVDVLDEALTAAERHLEKLLGDFATPQIKADFLQHIHTHLGVELDNIRSHGHRGDDPDFNPDKPVRKRKPLGSSDSHDGVKEERA